MSTDFDLIVIGAGIQGVGVAQAAAAAGQRVLILERQAIAVGTSSRSSKLIHGGLRYLEQFQLGLVRESLRERAILTRIAPGLVHLMPFRIPVLADMRRPAWQIHAGLALYRLLAGPGEGNGYTRHRRAALPDLDGMDRDSVRALFEYHDGQTDDAALTRAVLASAVALGAVLHLPAEVSEVTLEAEGVRVRWAAPGGPESASARAVVNATGPWVNETLRRVRPALAPLAIDLVRGTHLELPAQALAANYYVEAPQDGRAVFVMPRAGHVLVGTTEVAQAEPAPVTASMAEIDYLQAVVARRFPGWSPTQREPSAAWAGLRVLPRSEGAAFGRSREVLLAVDRERRPRLLSLCGGKLTTYRATAAEVLERLAGSLPERTPRADTATLMLG